MSSKDVKPLTDGTSTAQSVALTLIEVSRACAVEVGFVIELVQEGILAPELGQQSDDWRFTGAQLRDVAVAARLQRDLGVNPAGAALALQLLGEIETLRAQLNATASAVDDDSV